MQYICNEHFWLDYGNNEFVVPYRNKNLNGIELGRDKDWKHWNSIQFNVHDSNELRESSEKKKERLVEINKN